MKNFLDPAEKLFNTKNPTKLQLSGMLIMAPLLGGLFVVFLPFIGFALVIDFLGKKAYTGIKAGTTNLAMVLSPEWRPGEAYFLGRPKKKSKKS